MKRFDRRALFASGAAAALLAATGVAATPSRGGRLRAALSPDLFDRAVHATVFDTLTEIAADGTLRGELSTDWTSDAEARHWSFTLRRDVTFHDGTLLTAEHVTALPFDIQVAGTHQIDILLDTPDPNLPYHLAQPGFEVMSPTGAGTGLYHPHKLETGRHFIGTRVEHHWKTNAGWFDAVEFVQFGAQNVWSQALREGLVDVADIPALDALTDADAFQTLPGSGPTTHIASRSVTVPLTVGKTWPLDNLRMAERWWMG